MRLSSPSPSPRPRDATVSPEPMPPSLARVQLPRSAGGRVIDHDAEDYIAGRDSSLRSENVILVFWSNGLIALGGGAIREPAAPGLLELPSLGRVPDDTPAPSVHYRHRR